ncbi:hypothetical protein HUX88_05385 [Duganella sp. BJB1802]|uniref:hypothetical protein n=1 Tax=Duganella sp. BJB1802 TaxID=2744575 RepID=UPI0015937E6B|nr:hypothetical protein [Duganella sp. BJB1802]NVD69987.1 hypothetical protein [Duganella sp. BJB1802]
MKLKARRPDRFQAPTALQGDAPFLGATVRQWDRAIVGNMEQTLAQIKRQAASAPKRDVATATTFDVASYASRRLPAAK